MFIEKILSSLVDPIPFPHIVFDNFLPANFSSLLSNDFPDSDETNKWENVMGGRKRLNIEQKEFSDLIQSKSSWNELYNYLNNHELFDLLVKKFEDELIKNDIKIDNLYFNPYKFFNKEKSIKIENKIESHLYFDISSASKGYKREVHRDTDPRLFVFLGFLNDFDTTLGGDFILNTFKEKKFDYFDLPRQPDETDMMVFKKIKPKFNRFIFFLSTKDSYHSVSEILSNNKRLFIYGSFTTSIPVWPGKLG